jgi:hypothetical protein
MLVVAYGGIFFVVYNATDDEFVNIVSNTTPLKNGAFVLTISLFLLFAKLLIKIRVWMVSVMITWSLFFFISYCALPE